MPLMPKRVKFRKSSRGVLARQRPSRQHSQLRRFRSAIAGRRLVERRVHRSRPYHGHTFGARRRPVVYSASFRISRSLPIPAETRMGKGKGEPEYWAAVVKPGMILYESGGLPEAAARDALARRGVQDAVQVPFRDAPAERRLRRIGR